MGKQLYDYENVTLKKDIYENKQLIEGIFKNDAVFRIRDIIAGANGRKAVIYYIDGMVNSAVINDSVVRPMMLYSDSITDLSQIQKQILFCDDVSVKTSVKDMLKSILYGDTVLILDGEDKALVINTKGFKTRGINEPEDERVLQGPREGFSEAAMTNLSLLRRKLQTPDLCIELLSTGRRTQTAVFVCYLGGLADKKTVENIKSQIKKIDIDGVLDGNYITEIINKNRFSFFKTAGSTERPDIVAARLLEGRIAIVTDGSPVVYTVPYLFSENFQSDEDYYLNFTVSSLGRILRYICFIIAIAVPGVFVALTTHHVSLLPTTFMMTVTRLRSGVPMSSVSECLILIFVFEILKETGLRSPQSMGHALSIVGGLVVGQAAVEAGIISAPMLIAVALSGIAGLMVPKLRAAVFYIKLICVVFSAFLGLYGFFAVISVTLIRILSLKSFGVDYTVSLTTPKLQNLKDTLIRAPWYSMIFRPIFNKNLVRKKTDEENN